MPRKQKKYHYLYKTTNLINNKFYVGMHSTNDLNDGYLGSGTHLRRSIRKYGKEKFVLVFLEFFDTREILIEKEKELVDKDFIKDPLCMNLRIGGTCAPESNYGTKRSEASKLKMSQWVRTEEQCKKMSDNWWNSEKRNTQEWKDNLGKAWIGKTHTDESKIKMSNSHKGKFHSEESKIKMSKTAKGKISFTKPVLQFDLNNNLIRKWDSASQANLLLGISNIGISRCCIGKRKSYKKFIWKFEFGDKKIIPKR